MSNHNQGILTFWQWLKEHRSDFDTLADSADPFWDVILRRLHRLDKHLRFEISEPYESNREFIITAEGHVEAFHIAKAIVARTPRIPGWRFIALKPPMGFDFKITYEGIPFDPKAMWFLPLVNSLGGKELGLRIAVPKFTKAIKRQATNAIAIILETALGERAAALDIQYFEVSALPRASESGRYLALHELPRFIAWRKRRNRRKRDA